MTDIKELAVQIAQDMGDDEGTDRWIIDYAQRFLAAYLAEQNKLCALNHLPPRPEPAPQQQNQAQARVGMASQTSQCEVKSASKSAVGAAPSSDEVREMVKRLRALNPLNTDADLIERLAARVPDGHVVVPREPTEEMCQAASAKCHHPQALYKTAYKAMIAAGEVKS